MRIPAKTESKSKPYPIFVEKNIQTQTGNVLHKVELFDQNLHKPTLSGNHIRNSIFICICNEQDRCNHSPLRRMFSIWVAMHSDWKHKIKFSVLFAA
jgi:hypothetical protein